MMYEQLLAKYGVFFEGLPEPVFHGGYYPMGDPEELRVLGLIGDFHYGWGLKEDKDPRGTLLKQYRASYENDLLQVLRIVADATADMRRGVAVIPSSSAGKVNRITELLRCMLAHTPGSFDDLTEVVTRTRSKRRSHGGRRMDRSYRESYDSIGLAKDSQIKRYDVILVVDDMLTSGKSFRAMNDRLRDSGYAGTIVNFALLRSCRGEAILPCRELKRPDSPLARAQRLRKEQNATKRVEALVLDLGQTLLDDSSNDLAFEGQFFSRDSAQINEVPYAPYQGVESLTRLGIPYAIASDRTPRQLAKLFADRTVSEALFPHREEASSLPPNVFTYPIEERNGFTVRHYRPSPRGILEAVAYLRDEPLGGSASARIIGLGNTFDDVVAFEAAGIESALALWGIPQAIREGARADWCASHSFESVEAFAEWIASDNRSSWAD